MTFMLTVHAKVVTWWQKIWESLSRHREIEISDKKSCTMFRTMLIEMDWNSVAENKDSKNMEFPLYVVV